MKEPEDYNNQNLLAHPLRRQAYNHNPGFLKFIQESQLLFNAHAAFKRADIDARQQLYRSIAERIRSPELLQQDATS